MSDSGGANRETGSRQKLVNIQILRGAAASLVVVDHAIDELVTRHEVSAFVGEIGWFCGWLGVASFFVISGMVMVLISEREVGARAAFRFGSQRLLRVVPPYWFATFLYLGLWLLRGRIYPGGDILSSLFFIPYLSDFATGMRPIVGQGWTLNLEMFFYAIFTLSLLIPHRAGRPIIACLLPLLVIAGLAVRPLFPYMDPSTRLQFWTDPIILCFVYGICIGYLKLPKPPSGRGWWPIATSACLFGTALFVFGALDVRFPLPTGWQLFFGILCALAVLLCAMYQPGRVSKVQAGLSSVGDASYSTYLFHPLALTILNGLYGHLPAGLRSPFVFVVMEVVAATAVGLAVHRLLERPFMRYAHRLKGRAPASSRDIMAGRR